VVAAATRDALVLYEREALLRGVPTPTRTVPLPWPGRTDTSLTGDGTLAVLAGPDAVRALRLDTFDPMVVWELRHDPWPDGRPPGPAEVSPDGTRVVAMVPRLHVEAGGSAAGPVVLVFDDDDRRYATDRWTVLDARTGAVTAHLPVPVVTGTTFQLWHPTRPQVAVSAWMAWYGWSTWWAATDGEHVAVARGPRMRRVTDLHPGGACYLSVRLAEQMTDDDTINNAAVHRLPDHVEDAVLDVAGLDPTHEDEELTDCRYVTPTDVLTVVTVDRTGQRPATHWWCGVDLRPRAPIDYPVAVTCDLAPMGDGTWLTHDGTGRLYRWAFG
jgi:hypothetical protein